MAGCLPVDSQPAKSYYVCESPAACGPLLALGAWGRAAFSLCIEDWNMKTVNPGNSGYTAYTLEQVLVAIETAHTKSGVSRSLGISFQTVTNYCRRWKSVEEAFRFKRREIVDLAEGALRRAVETGEPWAVTFALKTLGKDDGFTERHEITGPNAEPIQFIDVTRATEAADVKDSGDE